MKPQLGYFDQGKQASTFESLILKELLETFLGAE